MKSDGWWRDPLMDWADTTGIELTLESYAKPQLKREMGEWWLDAGRWSLHLDTGTFAWFHPNPDTTLRRTLTWLLINLRRTEEPGPEVLLSGWFEGLLEQTPEELTQLVTASQSVNLPEANWANHYETGWFALITPQYPKTVSLAERIELRQNIIQVLESYLDQGIVGWLNTAGTGEHVLLHIAENTLQNNDGWVGAQARDTTEAVDLIHFFAEEMLDALTQDVLISCDLLVGRYFDGIQELPDSLLTLALLRIKDTAARAKGLTIWGENPLNVLLRTVPQQGIRWFLDEVHSRVKAAPETAGGTPGSVLVNQLPEELLISLRGIVEANLNVSEAARDLFIHRNTLIHRLDKLKELTGYDARVFQDALILWLAYLSSQPGETKMD